MIPITFATVEFTYISISHFPGKRPECAHFEAVPNPSLHASIIGIHLILPEHTGELPTRGSHHPISVGNPITQFIENVLVFSQSRQPTLCFRTWYYQEHKHSTSYQVYRSQDLVRTDAIYTHLCIRGKSVLNTCIHTDNQISAFKWKLFLVNSLLHVCSIRRFSYQ